jgi:LCP family protein required for cell wall assembly
MTPPDVEPPTSSTDAGSTAAIPPPEPSLRVRGESSHTGPVTASPRERHTPDPDRPASAATLERMAPHGRLTRVLVAVTASLALVMSVVGVGTAIQWRHLRGVGTRSDFQEADPSGSPGPGQPTGPCSQSPCNYLLLGSDSRAGLPIDEQHQFGTNQQIGGTNRADTIMLVHTDPALQEATVLSFPRDLWVDIPGHGFNRINAGFEGGLEHGGPQLMAQTVANLTGLRVDHYLYVDLAGFQQVVDKLGGVDLCIPQYDVNTPGYLGQHVHGGGMTQIYYSEPGYVADPNTGLHVKPGCQHLDGYQALAYVRTRSLPCDVVPDFSRIGRQQQFLRALIGQMLKPSELAKAPGLVDPILASLHRDNGFLPGDLVYLVGQLRGISTGAVQFRTVPAVGAMIHGQSVVRMEPSAKAIFVAIRDGKPLGETDTQLVGTPPSEATTQVAVIDHGSGGLATGVEDTLTTAGFDVAPGIVDGANAPKRVHGAAIVFGPGQDAYARVVAAYFPGLPLVQVDGLRVAPVAVVATRSFTSAANGGTSPGASDCPA